MLQMWLHPDFSEPCCIIWSGDYRPGPQRTLQWYISVGKARSMTTHESCFAAPWTGQSIIICLHNIYKSRQPMQHMPSRAPIINQNLPFQRLGQSNPPAHHSFGQVVSIMERKKKESSRGHSQWCTRADMSSSWLIGGIDKHNESSRDFPVVTIC